LINNAGIVHKKSILDTTAEEVEQYVLLHLRVYYANCNSRTFRVNTLSHFITLRTFLPHMLREGRGTIVTVSSVLGHLGAANLSAYTASKAALLALHHSLRAELAQIPEAAEIKTILVTPGQMSTRMFADVKPPSNFFAPLATPADLGKAIIRLIERGESGDVAIPLYSHYIGFFSILPVGIQQIVRRWSGLDTAVGSSRKSEIKEKK
jgi:short-subunit dehydrogenase